MFRASHFTFLLAVLCLVAMLLPPPTQAAVDCTEKPDHPRCNGGGGDGGGDDDGGGGGEPIDLTDTDAHVTGAIEDQLPGYPRRCMVSNVHQGRVLYSCSLEDVTPPGDKNPEVYFDLGPGARVGRKSEACLCEKALSGVTLVPNSRYKYTGHYEGIENLAGFHPVFAGPNVTDAIAGAAPDCSRVGLIVLNAFGELAPSSNPNPYAIEQQIPIDTINVQFKGEGTNKTVAECDWSEDRSGDGHLGVGDVEFISNPVP